MDRRIILLVVALALTLTGSVAVHVQPVSAAGMVGDGTLGSCTGQKLADAMNSGSGYITFNCNLSDPPLVIQQSGGFWVEPGQSYTIDGWNNGHPVTLRGNDKNRLFTIYSNGQVGGALTLKNMTLEWGNSTGDYGGCLLVQPNGTLVLDNVTVRHCETIGFAGGAIYGDSASNITLMNHSKVEYAVNYNWGAINSIGTVTITNSIIENNLAANGGAGLSVGGNVFIQGSTFQGNFSQNGNGGAIWSNANLQIDGSTFFQNTATNGLGGGIYSQNVLNMTNSTLDTNHADNGGGGIETALGTTTLQNVTVISNSVAIPGQLPTANGAGLENTGGSLFLTNVTVSSNSGSPSLLPLHGGGIYNNGSTTLMNSKISGNTGAYGGGIANNGTLAVTNSTITGNYGVPFDGGGIWNHSILSLLNSTLDNNIAEFYGGGIWNIGEARVTNSTVSHNQGAYGSGILNVDPGGVARAGVLLENVTISGNMNWGGAASSGIWQSSAYPFIVENTILEKGTNGSNCHVEPGWTPITSLGYNISNDLSCATFFNQPGDLVNTTPILFGPLANNGGPTLTHMPLAVSLAIDAIPNSTNDCGTSVAADQRGAPRPVNGKCDIGAVESGASLPLLWLPLIKR